MHPASPRSLSTHRRPCPFDRGLPRTRPHGDGRSRAGSQPATDGAAPRRRRRGRGRADLETFLTWDDAQAQGDYGPPCTARSRMSWRAPACTGTPGSLARLPACLPACLPITLPWSCSAAGPLRRDARLLRPLRFRPLPGPHGRTAGRLRLPTRRSGRRAARRGRRRRRGGAAGEGAGTAVAGRLDPVLAGFGRRQRARAAARAGPVGRWGPLPPERSRERGRQARSWRNYGPARHPSAGRGAAGDARTGGVTAGRHQAIRRGPRPSGGRSARTGVAAGPGPGSCCGFSTVRPEGTCAPCPHTCDADPVTKLRAAAAS